MLLILSILLPGDCGTYDEVSSGTEVRLLVNYEVA